MSVEDDPARDRRRRPEAVDRERAFGIDVFVCVSAYPREHLEGRPHHLIRHGRPVAAYVENVAADGCSYWVLAVAAPAGDDGCVSVRTKPTTPLLGAARAVYADLLAFEQQFAGDDVAPRARHRGVRRASASSSPAPASRATRRARRQRPPGVDRVATRLLARLADHADPNATLKVASHRVRALAGDVRDFSTNAMPAANRLAGNRLALASVADQLRNGSDAVAPVMDALTAEVGAAIACVDATRFPIAAGKLGAQMAVRSSASSSRAATARATRSGT